MKSLILLAALLILAVAFTPEEYRTAFTGWMIKNGKAYTNEEFQTRFAIFKDNMDYVRDWNAANKHTVIGLNLFADLSNEEYQSIYLGTKYDATDLLRASTTDDDIFLANSTVDWVTDGAVTGIKNQGQCGSCWSFSTTGSVEGAWFLAGNDLVSLSEQNLMDCTYGAPYDNEGCNGGLMDNAFKYIIANNGIDTEASYPYTMAKEACQFNAANVGANISSFQDVKTGSESALAAAAADQPISVAIDASQRSFQLYTSGIYVEKNCSSTNLDHGVLVVGYGSTSDGDYWLVKNSWGTTWGEKGYIQMARNKNNQCGIATMASYPTV